jgi:5-methylcytosine-specific restriction endonuclease McrA
MGYDTNSWIACEVCGATAVDIHHIESRGMGGSKHADTIENLMALCRTCHTLTVTSKSTRSDFKQHTTTIYLKELFNYETSTYLAGYS